MSFASLNVWIHDIEDPCRISDKTWFVQVTDCSTNRIVRWCDRVYARIPARCGHVEIRLPPGCYTVTAALSVAIRPPFVYANYNTHVGFANVDCREHACVHLYSPTYRYCLKFTLLATQMLAKFQAVPQDQADELTRAINAMVENLPRTAADAGLDLQISELPEIMASQVEEDNESEEGEST